MTITSKMNDQFGLGDRLSFIEGKGDFPFIRISNSHADAQVSVYGGQVLSYRPKGCDDVLFLSDNAYFEDGKAIKGGVPVCWPWFGPHPEDQNLPAHGFVRNSMWNILQTETLDNDATKVTLGLDSTPETLAIWPYPFSLVLDIIVGQTLRLELTTKNTGNQAFSITQALHTYFSVADIGLTIISGLEDRRYIDKTSNGAVRRQDGDIIIETEVDRVYSDVPPTLTIVDNSRQRNIQITSGGNNTAVVWNPWAELSRRSGDLRDDDYKRFVCVETANAMADLVDIQAGHTFSLTTEISCRNS